MKYLLLTAAILFSSNSFAHKSHGTNPPQSPIENVLFHKIEPGRYGAERTQVITTQDTRNRMNFKYVSGRVLSVSSSAEFKAPSSSIGTMEYDKALELIDSLGLKDQLEESCKAKVSGSGVQNEKPPKVIGFSCIRKVEFADKANQMGYEIVISQGSQSISSIAEVPEAEWAFDEKKPVVVDFAFVSKLSDTSIANSGALIIVDLESFGLNKVSELNMVHKVKPNFDKRPVRALGKASIDCAGSSCELVFSLVDEIDGK